MFDIRNYASEWTKKCKSIPDDPIDQDTEPVWKMIAAGVAIFLFMTAWLILCCLFLGWRF